MSRNQLLLFHSLLPRKGGVLVKALGILLASRGAPAGVEVDEGRVLSFFGRGPVGMALLGIPVGVEELGIWLKECIHDVRLLLSRHCWLYSYFNLFADFLSYI